MDFSHKVQDKDLWNKDQDKDFTVKDQDLTSLSDRIRMCRLHLIARTSIR